MINISSVVGETGAFGQESPWTAWPRVTPDRH